MAIAAGHGGPCGRQGSRVSGVLRQPGRAAVLAGLPADRRPCRGLRAQSARQPAPSLLRRSLLEARHAWRAGAEEGYLADHGEDRMVLWAAVRRLSRPP